MTKYILSALMVMFLFAAPATAKMMKHANPGPGVGPGTSLVNGAGGGVATQAGNLKLSALCAESNGALNDLCNDNEGAGGGIWWCSTSPCTAAGWLRADDGRTFNGALRGLTSAVTITDAATLDWINWDNMRYDDGGWQAELDAVDPTSPGGGDFDEYFIVPPGYGTDGALAYVEICSAFSLQTSPTTFHRVTTRINDAVIQGGYDNYTSGAKVTAELTLGNCTGPQPIAEDDYIRVFMQQKLDETGRDPEGLDILTTDTFFSIRELH